MNPVDTMFSLPLTERRVIAVFLFTFVVVPCFLMAAAAFGVLVWEARELWRMWRGRPA